MSLSHLNAQQQEAVRSVEGPLMVVAGPGSGKTRVMTYRIAHLIGIGVPAYRILALTFTNKAANEMKSRIVQLVGEPSRQIRMGTFHSVFARILRTEAEKIGYQRNFSIYDETDVLGVIKDILSSFGISAQQFNPYAIRSRISNAKNQLLSVDEYAQKSLDLFEQKTAIVFREYQQRLKRNNAMDFDDLLLKPIELFRGNTKVLEKYQEYFRFILVDEFQDTNRAQYALIHELACRYKNICVVGDDAQSIYAFRGADIRNILDFQRDYPETKIIRLEQNYRCTGTILSAADHLIKHNPDQIAKDLWTQNPGGDLITVLDCRDDRDEGETIVTRIFEQLQRLKLDLKDVAIMYRTNSQSRSLEDALRKNSVPYTIVGGVEFYQRKEVKDVLAYLRILVNRQDNDALLRVLNYPARGLGDVAVSRLEAFAGEHSLSLADALVRSKEIAGLSKKAREGFHVFSALLEKYSALLPKITASELSRSLVDEIGILRNFKEEGTTEALSRWENVQELLSAISEFTADHEGSGLAEFLEDAALVAAVDDLDENRNAVTLMTLHSAKGLEYPVVFITGLEEGLLPLYTSMIETKELEEERRLCYVGITRAMKKLFFSYARIRYRFGEMTYQSSSRFLEEIPDELVEKSGRQRYTGLPERSVHTPAWRRRSSPDEDSHYHSDVVPDYDHGDEEGERMNVGMHVEHSVFGRGKILAISGQGESLKAVIDFDSVGRKNLLLKYAHLKTL